MSSGGNYVLIYCLTFFPLKWKGYDSHLSLSLASLPKETKEKEFLSSSFFNNKLESKFKL